VLVHSKKLAALEGIERAEEEERERRFVTSENLVLKKVFWDAFCLTCGNIFAHCESIWLGEEICHELFVIRHWLTFHIYWRLRLGVSDKLSWNSATLMHQLVETVLSVGSWLTENYWATVDTLCISDTVPRHSLSIAFHITLLDMSWESKKSLAIRKNGPRGMTTDVGVVPSKESHEHTNVLGVVGLSAEVLVNGMHTIQEGLHVLKTVVEGQR